MRQQMATKEMIVIPDDDEESCAAVSKSPPPAAPVEPPPPARTPPRAPSTPPPARPSTRSPPRYPSTSPGTAKVVTVPVLRLEADGRQMSPRAANIRALGTAFNNSSTPCRASPQTAPSTSLVAPRPVQAEGMLLSPMVPARLPSLPTSPQMRKGEGRGRGGRIELTPEHVSFPLCIIVQIHVVLFYIFSKIYYSAPNHRSIRFQALLHH